VRFFQPHYRCVLFLTLFPFGCGMLSAQAPPAPGSQAQLRIVIVEGQGAINNIKDRVTREPVVQVVDENQRPVAGAAVSFFLPNQGPGGTFPDGTRTLTVTTDAQGRAVAAHIKRNNVAGQMQIRVTASYSGQTATALITQTNLAGGSSPGLSATAKVLIAVGLAGGAAAGAIAATHGGGSSNTPAPAPAITITAGTPTVGAPR